LAAPISLTKALRSLAVNKAIGSSLLVAGAQCLVVLMDAENPSDGSLVSVW